MPKLFRSLLVFVASFIFILHGRLSAAPPFVKETGPLLSTAAPQAITGPASNQRMYFLRDYQVYSATSTDGLNWGVESGVRLSSSTRPSLSISSVTGFSLLSIAAGGYRALYTATDTNGVMQIFMATSSDGLAWANISTAITPASTATFVGSPRLFKLSSGDWKLYYVQNISSGSLPANNRAFAIVSTDEGVTWGTSSLLFSSQVGELAVSSLTDQRVRLYYTTPLSTETALTQVFSALSSDVNGTSFSSETGVRLATSSAGGAYSSLVVVRSSDTFRWRMYTGFTQSASTFTHTFSALTQLPSLKTISPSVVNRGDPAHTYTIVGEIFSTSPTLKLTRDGQSDIPGTSVTRSDDQTITTVFDTVNKEKGLWSLVITNSDGQTLSVSGAVTITFAGGFISMTDNLLRPLSGMRTQIDVSIFDAGRLRIKLYSMDGRLVRTLLDEDRGIGTVTVFWDGRNSEGNLVASGTYVVMVEGPKLNARNRIVVIK